MENKRQNYLDGLKAIACIGVFLTHFYGAFMNPQLSGTVMYLGSDLLKVLLDGDFQIGIFCVISGYLAAKSAIKTPAALVKKSLGRYLRFSLPIFFICLVIFLIEKMLGFYNGEAGRTLGNSWFAGYYSTPHTVLDLFTSPFFKLWFMADDSFSGPFWMLCYMLLGSLLTYLGSFLMEKFPKIRLVIFLALTVLAFFIHYVTFACLLGAGIGWFIREVKNGKGLNYLFAALAMLILWLVHSGHMQLLPKISPEAYLSGKFVLDGYFKAFYAALLLICLMGTKWIKLFLGLKPMAWLGRLSFGVYAFHWPVICSFAAVLFTALYGTMDYTAMYGILFAVSVLMTFGISWLFAKYVEPVCSVTIGAVLKERLKK
ncbi:MAG: acyltransferase [Christensenellaceae bacterium]|nr:acyltransferase [Christensenellaceae bacterium]